MRLLTVLLITGAAFAAKPSPGPTAYHSGNEYVYEYVTHALSGIPAAANQFAGLKVKALVRLQVKSGSTFLMKMDKILICRVNGEISRRSVMEPLPESESVCSPVTGPESDAMIEQLQKPINFKYKQGIVSELEVSPEEPHWCVNLKRGVLSLLNLNMLETEALPDVPRQIYDDVMYNKDSRRSALSKFYRTMEEDLVGDCESIYAIDDSDVSGEAMMEVTKIRNYDNCRSKPILAYGMLSNIKCMHCKDETKKPLMTTSHVDYQLSGNRRDFVIQSAEHRGKIIFTPFTMEEGQSSTFTFQKLHLVKSNRIEEAIRLEKKRERTDSLRMYIPAKVLPAVVRHAPERETKEKILVIEKLLSEAVRQVSPVVELTAPVKVIQIVELMRELPTENLIGFVKAVCMIPTPSEEDMLKREIVLDILPTLGRLDVISLLEDLITKNIISHHRAALMVNLVSLTATPSKESILELMHWCDSRVVSGHVQLRRAILLGAGALTFRLDKICTEMSLPKEVHIDSKHAIVEKFRTMLKKAPTEEEKVTVVKAIGNTGLADFILDLQNIAVDRTLSGSLRAKALYSLRKFTPLAGNKIRSICMPLFRDTGAPREVRLAAFLMTMTSHPSPAVIQMIAHHLNTEPSTQIASFVFTYLSEMANSRFPCHRNISRSCRSALRYVQPPLTGIHYSRTLVFRRIAKLFGAIEDGDIVNFITNTDKTLLPDSFVTILNSETMGMRFSMGEMGLEGKGMETILQNLMGPESMLKDLLKGKLALRDIMEPITSYTKSSVKDIQQIMDKISLTERSLSKLDFKMYVKMFSQELRYFHFDKSYLSTLFSELENSVPRMMDVLLRGYNVNLVKTFTDLESGVMVPSPCGLPVSLNITSSTVARVTGQIKLEGISSLMDIFTTSGPKPTITIKTDLKPSISSHMSGSMGVHLCVLKTMTSLHSRHQINLPTKLEVSLNLASGKAQITSIVPEEEIVMMTNEISPVTVFKKYFLHPTSESCLYEEKEIMNTALAYPNKVVYPVGGDVIGLTTEFHVTYPASKMYTPLMKCLIGKMECTAILKPDSNSPKRIEIEGIHMNSEKMRDSKLKSSIWSSSSEEYESQEQTGSWWSFSSKGSSYTENPFEPVPVKPTIKSPIQNQVLLSVRTKGHRSPRTIDVQVTHVCDAETYLKHQLNVQTVLDIPISSSTTEPRKLVIDGIVELPEHLIYSTAEPQYPELICNLNVMYGPKSSPRNICTLKVSYDMLKPEHPLYSGQPRGEYSYEEYSTSRPGRYEYDSRESYRTPVDQYTSSREEYDTMHSEQGRKMHDTYPLNKDVRYTMDKKPILVTWTVEYVKIPEHCKFSSLGVYYRILSMLEKAYPSLYITRSYKENAPDRVSLLTIFRPNSEQIELAVETPHETVGIYGVPVSWFFRFYQPSTLHSMPLAQYVAHKTTGSRLMPAKCEMQEGSVRTFDLQTFELNEPTIRGCEAVLSQDCSSRKSFVITAKPMREEPTLKLVKVYLGHKTVEVLPSSGWFRKDLSVLIDGQKLSIRSGEPMEVLDSDRKPVCNALKTTEMVKIDCPRLGFVVKTNGKSIEILTSALLSARVCGLCGDLNGEMRDEYRGPDMTLHPSPEHFISSYLIESDTCDVRTIQQGVQGRKSPPKKGCKKIQVTKIIEKVMDTKNQKSQPHLCFSIEPVPVCSGSCQPIAERLESRGFHCLPKDSKKAERMKSKVYKNKVVHEFTNKVVHFYEEVKIQPKCNSLV